MDMIAAGFAFVMGYESDEVFADWLSDNPEPIDISDFPEMMCLVLLQTQEALDWAQILCQYKGKFAQYKQELEARVGRVWLGWSAALVGGCADASFLTCTMAHSLLMAAVQRDPSAINHARS